MKSRPEITRKLILSLCEGILLEVGDLAARKTLCSADLLGFRVVFSLIRLLRSWLCLAETGQIVERSI